MTPPRGATQRPNASHTRHISSHTCNFHRIRAFLIIRATSIAVNIRQSCEEPLRGRRGWHLPSKRPAPAKQKAGTCQVQNSARSSTRIYCFCLMLPHVQLGAFDPGHRVCLDFTLGTDEHGSPRQQLPRWNLARDFLRRVTRDAWGPPPSSYSPNT